MRLGYLCFMGGPGGVDCTPLSERISRRSWGAGGLVSEKQSLNLMSQTLGISYSTTLPAISPSRPRTTRHAYVPYRLRTPVHPHPSASPSPCILPARRPRLDVLRPNTCEHHLAHPLHPHTTWASASHHQLRYPYAKAHGTLEWHAATSNCALSPGAPTRQRPPSSVCTRCTTNVPPLPPISMQAPATIHRRIVHTMRVPRANQGPMRDASSLYRDCGVSKHLSLAHTRMRHFTTLRASIHESLCGMTAAAVAAASMRPHPSDAEVAPCPWQLAGSPVGIHHAASRSSSAHPTLVETTPPSFRDSPASVATP